MDKHIIGENAGKLWRLLSTDAPRKWTLQEVKDATGFNDLEAASAIGWLAREDKIQFENRKSACRPRTCPDSRRWPARRTPPHRPSSEYPSRPAAAHAPPA